jgi:hypothetical protein
MKAEIAMRQIQKLRHSTINSNIKNESPKPLRGAGEFVTYDFFMQLIGKCALDF